MSVNLQLRAWQARFADQLERHPTDDFLLVACPAAGKTIGAAAGIARVMLERDCDQLVVVCPTVVVRDQWAAVLGELGYRMRTTFDREGWPAYVHGVCATYAQVASRVDTFARACEQRRTVAVFDEIHHAGARLSWGDAIRQSFEHAVMRLMMSGTPFRSDEDRIPFLRYTREGKCRPDFAYDYQQAVSDGVCRTVEFRAHDGEITWDERDEHGEPITARFSDKVEPAQMGRRLRASLDPTQPYLAAMLADAHEDLLQLRERVPDAAGLVVCDSQAHALAVDRLLAEIAGALPVLAMSDIPRAHEAIANFAHETEPWLVSVRMVSEGVDIPRLGVVVWATASSTELMVRQVAGRALRGRGEHATLPAIVHVPADPRLIRYAERLDVLTGISLSRDRGDRDRERTPRPSMKGKWRRGDSEIDPTPFVEWFDNLANGIGAEAVGQRCGFPNHTATTRTLHRWRSEGAYAYTYTLYDLCHMGGADFDTLFADEKYAKARELLHDPGDFGGKLDLGSVEAQPLGDAPRTIAPNVQARTKPVDVPEPVAIATPELPPSPNELLEAERAHEGKRGDVMRLLGVYSQLQRAVNPAYQLATAHIEMTREVGPVRIDSPVEQLDEAFAWVQQRTAALAKQYPEHFKQLVRTRRRLSMAA